MKLIKLGEQQISVAELLEMSEKMFGGLVKAVVDLKQGLMLIDAELHADQELVLLENYGSDQSYLWGINLHPDKYGTNEFVEFDSMINMRPAWNNLSRGVDSLVTQAEIVSMVKKMVKA